MPNVENLDTSGLNEFLDETLDLGLHTFQTKLRTFVAARGGIVEAALQPWDTSEFADRSRILYRWCGQARYQAARMRQLKDGHFTFWVYRAGSCDMHQELNGLALSPSHTFWVTHTPANGLWCSCYVVGTDTRAGVKRLGGDPDKTLPSGWNDLLPETGLPQGIEPGFGGASHPDTLACLIALRSGNYDLSPAA